MKNGNLSWWQVRNLMPVITSLIVMTLAFAALKSDIALLNQKVDMILAQQEKIITQYENLEKRYGELALKVNRIDTEHELNRR